MLAEIDPVRELGPWQVALSIAPVLLILAASVWLKLGQTGRIAWATLRATVQLIAVGLIIGWVFQQNTWMWILALLAVMTLIAGITAAGELDRILSRTSIWLSVMLGAITAVSLVYFTQAVIGVHQAEARYFIPVGGMILGNAITAAVLAGERIAARFADGRRDIEAYLVLGASPWQAARPIARQAIAAALTPTVNAMLIVGVVKLPGMMTGQMLGGAEPYQAAMYQLMILIAILFASILAAGGTAWMLFRRYFTRAWQLRRSA
jgi:putative ABC transport system permease protein